MMGINKTKNWFFAIIFAMSFGGFSTAIVSTQTVSAACATTPKIVTIPAWYSGLLEDDCQTIMSPEEYGGLSQFIWRIALNVVEILLHIVGYVAVGYIIYGGFTYLISTGMPDKITSAKKTIQNAVIGLLISIASIALVNLVTGII